MTELITVEVLKKNLPIITSDVDGNLVISTTEAKNQWFLDEEKILADTFKILTPSKGGVYYAVVTNSEGYYSISDKFTVTTNKATIRKEIKVYPNPVSNVFFIENIKTDTYSIAIVDLTGNAIYKSISHNSGNNSIEMNVASLPKGIYFVKIESDHSMSNFKFVKN